ncbi:MAG: AEC family transporter [Rhizobiales bacterium]|nr:AEC family transporter [Hyphomicrobiales bacterium]
MLTILNLALPFFGLIVAGFIAAKVFRLPEDGLAWLNILIVYFALPAMIFLTVSATPFDKLIDWPFVLATSLATYLTFIVPFIISVFILRTRITAAAIQGTSASFGNVGYMGLPLAVAFFGREAAVPAALIFCFDCTLQFTLTPLLATLGRGEDRPRKSPGTVLLEVMQSVFTHPFIIATILGVLASALKFSPPVLIDSFLQMISRAAAPSALFALGVTLGMRRLAGIGPELPFIVIMKLFIHPALVFALLTMMGGTSPLWFSVALMMAALPTATNAFILASQYKRYVEGASSSILITTIISAFTLPTLVYLLTTGIIRF